jgi:hypothetical protein
LFGVLSVFGRNRIIPLMRRPNTDSRPNKPVTLPRNQLLIRYVVTSLVHTVAIRWYAVTLQVCSYPNTAQKMCPITSTCLWECFNNPNSSVSNVPISCNTGREWQFISFPKCWQTLSGAPQPPLNV